MVMTCGVRPAAAKLTGPAAAPLGRSMFSMISLTLRRAAGEPSGGVSSEKALYPSSNSTSGFPPT